MKTIKKILYLLTPKEKKQGIFLLFLILTMAFFDMLGVASILPFITILTNPDLIETNIILKNLYQKSFFFGVENEKQFLFISGIAVFILLIISLSLKAITQYAQIRFSLMREYSIGKRLVEGYLSQPYVWFLKRHSADIGKNILSEVNMVIVQTIVPAMNLVVQCSVTVAILSLLIIIDPILALCVGFILTFSYWIIFISIKKFLSRIGSERLEANKVRFTIISEVFGAIKETKLAGLEKIYVNRFSKPAKIYATNQSLAMVIGLLPRYCFEGIAFGGMIVLVLILMARDGNFISIMPTIALYAFAGYRLMPALQQTYTAITQLRFSSPTLNILYNDLVELQSYEQEKNVNSFIKLTKSITLENISFNYPDTKINTLKNINLKIEAFKKIGIVGTTGSGKTTMIDIILGLLDANDGILSVDNNPIDKDNRRSWQKSIGYVPQEIYLSDSSIESNIAFGVDSEDIDINSVEKATKIANLHDFIINELPEKYKTTLGERGIRLSGGQRQRIGIARALYRKPQILIMDEGTSALDNITEDAVMDAVNNLGDGITIILIAHRLSTVKNCDNIFLLEKGRLKAQGTYEHLLRTNEIFQRMLKNE